MENKKTIVGIVILTMLIIGIIVVVYLYSDFNTKQMSLLTQEANKILEANLIEDNIDLQIKTEKNYSKVEKTIKEYIVKIKNIYVEAEEMVSGINPNSIFSVQNMQDKNLEEIENIINDYKEKSQSLIEEYEKLMKLTADSSSAPIDYEKRSKKSMVSKKGAATSVSTKHHGKGNKHKEHQKVEKQEHKIYVVQNRNID